MAATDIFKGYLGADGREGSDAASRDVLWWIVGFQFGENAFCFGWFGFIAKINRFPIFCLGSTLLIERFQMILDSIVNIRKHCSHGTAIGILARKHEDVEQMFFETIEVNAFLVEDWGIVDVSEFIALDSMGIVLIRGTMILLRFHEEIHSFLMIQG